MQKPENSIGVPVVNGVFAGVPHASRKSVFEQMAAAWLGRQTIFEAFSQLNCSLDYMGFVSPKTSLKRIWTDL
ncbi:MAG: hypothetical protein VX438_06165 [Planctomycetota bacterium]|nr:hypothetical protein [Planctomycetota bacterium]